MTHEEYKEMLAEHALGALNVSEAREIEAHLATCAACRAELAEWRDIVAVLAYSAPPVEPSSMLRSRLLENIHATQAEQSGRAIEQRSDSVVAAPAERATSNVLQLPERVRPRLRAWQRYGALAASLAFAAFIIALVIFWNRNRETQAEMARLTRELQTTQEQLKSAQEKSEMFTAPDTRVATLNGTEIAPRAQARLAYNKAGKAMMIVDGLPPAPAGKDYQIWFIAGGKPVPGGVFKPDAAGHFEMHDQMPAAAQAAAAFAVTLEPQGGTLAPTGQKYLLGAASS